ncbi:MAG: HAD hydrolase-like protein, partial [Treponema sp.]|nr:HAD hydrolase-like protein [Treponema sp.]
MIDKKYKHILFDFDGTIADSSPGIFKAMKQTLKEYGINGVSESEYRKMVGPPLKYSFKEIFHFPEDKIDEAMLFYSSFYRNNSLLDCNIYDGIPELFKRLYDEGLKLYVATSKPESFA